MPISILIIMMRLILNFLVMMRETTGFSKQIFTPMEVLLREEKRNSTSGSTQLHNTIIIASFGTSII